MSNQPLASFRSEKTEGATLFGQLRSTQIDTIVKFLMDKMSAIDDWEWYAGQIRDGACMLTMGVQGKHKEENIEVECLFSNCQIFYFNIKGKRYYCRKFSCDFHPILEELKKRFVVISNIVYGRHKREQSETLHKEVRQDADELIKSLRRK